MPLVLVTRVGALWPTERVLLIRKMICQREPDDGVVNLPHPVLCLHTMYVHEHILHTYTHISEYKNVTMSQSWQLSPYQRCTEKCCVGWCGRRKLLSKRRSRKMTIRRRMQWKTRHSSRQSESLVARKLVSVHLIGSVSTWRFCWLIDLAFITS